MLAMAGCTPGPRQSGQARLASPRAAFPQPAATAFAEQSDPATSAEPVAALAAPWPTDLSGRFVWWSSSAAGDGELRVLDLASGRHERLWSVPGAPVLSPDRHRVAYVAPTRDGEELVVRELSAGAQPTVVAGDPTTGPASISVLEWDAEGIRLLVGRYPPADYAPQAEDRCELYAVSQDGTGERLLWAGSPADFPMDNGCPTLLFWDPASSRVAALEHGFEDPLSSRLTLLDLGGGGVVAHYDVQTSQLGHAQSPDGAWLASVDAPAYYGLGMPVAEAMHPSPTRWPGRAVLRLLHLASGELREVGGWETAVGLVHPVWSPDGRWLAVAEPLGEWRVAASPVPADVASGYPAPADPLPPAVATSEPTFQGSGTRIRMVRMDGTPMGEVTVDAAGAWPAAVSPDGRQVLVVTFDYGRRTADLHVVHAAAGTVSALATIWVGPTDQKPFIAWVP
jgi:hypothetical protein